MKNNTDSAFRDVFDSMVPNKDYAMHPLAFNAMNEARQKVCYIPINNVFFKKEKNTLVIRWEKEPNIWHIATIVVEQDANMAFSFPFFFADNHLTFAFAFFNTFVENDISIIWQGKVQ